MLRLYLSIGILSHKKDADVAKLADALDLGSSPKGWGFKSSHPHQKRKRLILIRRFLFCFLKEQTSIQKSDY